MSRIRMFMVTHPITFWSTVVYLVLLVCTFGFITIPSWKTGGLGQFGAEFLFFLPISLITFLLEDSKLYDPETKEHKFRIAIAFVIGLILAGVLMYLGHTVQSTFLG